MFQTKVVEKIKTHILCSVTFFFRKSVQEIQIRITDTLNEDLCTFMTISRSAPLRMRNVSDKCRENQDTYFM